MDPNAVKAYSEEGSIEGRLIPDQSFGREGKIGLEGPMDEWPIGCDFPESLAARAEASMGKRVSLEGKVRYLRFLGTEPAESLMVGVEVQEITVLREVHELPQFFEGEEIDITGGIAPEDYVRRMRDQD